MSSNSLETLNNSVQETNSFYQIEKNNNRSRSQKDEAICILVGVALAIIVGLTLLIVGCCGMTGSISMPYAVARVMVSIGASMLVGLTMLGIKTCCEKN